MMLWHTSLTWNWSNVDWSVIGGFNTYIIFAGSKIIFNPTLTYYVSLQKWPSHAQYSQFVRPHPYSNIVCTTTILHRLSRPPPSILLGNRQKWGKIWNLYRQATKYIQPREVPSWAPPSPAIFFKRKFYHEVKLLHF